tara:strand:- start:147 stop:434 length:288 start_codon:yes stop_codon:yes gene_type:complete
MSTIDQRIKIAIAAGSLVFAAGGFWALSQRDTAAISEQVVEVAGDLEEHEDLPAHPVTGAKLEVLVTEQRALRDDVARQAASLAAICQATGAQCR